MTDPELAAAYRQAFADTERDAVRRMGHFVETLPPAPTALVRRVRWVMPVGVAAAVAAITVTTLAITGGRSNPVKPAAAPPGASAHSAAPPASPLSASSAVAVRSGVATVASTSPPSRVSSHPSSSSAKDPTTYPTLGDPGITGPLAPYAKASAYTKVPAGLAVRKYADDIFTPDGVVRRFQMYICEPNEDPKVVAGGYLVIVTAPSYRFEAMDGEGPSLAPAGAAIHLGDRIWQWNTDHTVLISTGADADLYIGVLAARANNEFEPTIPTGYSTADIRLIAAGLHG